MRFAQRLSHALAQLQREDTGASAAEFALIGSLIFVLCLLLLLALLRDA